MFKTYHSNPLLWIFLFALAPLQGMEKNYEILQFFRSIETNDTVNLQRILKKNRTIVNETYFIPGNTFFTMTALEVAIISKNPPRVISLFLKSGAFTHNLNINNLFSKIGNSEDDRTYKNEIAHLLFCSGTPIDSGDNQPYKEDPQSLLRLWEANNADNEELLKITQAHIHTRLYTAIYDGNVDEVRRLVQKYTIDINNPLPCYSIYRYGHPDASSWNNTTPSGTILPLLKAIKHDNIVRLLVDELQADVNIQDAYGNSVLHYEPNINIAQLLISKGADTNIANNNGNTPLDGIGDWIFTPEGLQEIGAERVENYRSLKAVFEGKSPNKLPWKLIGGGVVVAVAVVAAKKLYSWWYTPSEQQEEENKSETQNIQQPVADVQK